MTTADTLALVDAERGRQRAKWGGRHHWGMGDCSSATVAVGAHAGDVPHLLRLAVLGEEFGEVARAVHDRDPEALARELVQVAAVAVAWREALG
jgi:hypothetical protein